MGFRSRALLTGVATGFLKANNDRRDRMAQRLQELSDNRATMERERAKSRADAASKAAADEHAQWSALRAEDFIDDEGNYQQNYFDKVAYAEFQKKETREAFGGNFQQFADEFKKTQGTKFIRQYKSPDQIEQSLRTVYDSIDARQRSELSRPAMTGFDAMLGSVVNRVTSSVGLDKPFGPPSDGTLSSEPTANLDVMAEQPQAGPAAPYERPNFQGPAPEADKIKTVTKVVDDKNQIKMINTYESGKQEVVDTNVKEAVGIKSTYLSYDEDGTEYAIALDNNGSIVTNEPTGLIKPNKAGTIDIKASDLKNPVTEETMNRIKDGNEAIRLVGNISKDADVETQAFLPSFVNKIVLGVQEEFVGTVGSEEQRRVATMKAMNAALGDEINLIDIRSPEDKRIGTTARNELAQKVAGLKQDRLALAYALVKLNRGSGRFNGQELQEQIELLSSGSLSEAMSVLRRAQEQVQKTLEFDVQQAAASVVSTDLMSKGKNISVNEVLGWSARQPVRDEKNGAYYVMFNTGPYKYAYVKPNSGVVLRKRSE